MRYRHLSTARVRSARRFKKSGRPIPANDAWIAALAMQYGLPILSLDAHFDAVPDVRRIGW
jgi:tRNA(fMet)-specific endonuclease VapC